MGNEVVTKAVQQLAGNAREIGVEELAPQGLRLLADLVEQDLARVDSKVFKVRLTKRGQEVAWRMAA